MAGMKIRATDQKKAPWQLDDGDDDDDGYDDIARYVVNIIL